MRLEIVVRGKTMFVSLKLLRLEARKESSTLGLGVGVWTEERSHGQRNIPLRVPVESLV